MSDDITQPEDETAGSDPMNQATRRLWVAVFLLTGLGYFVCGGWSLGNDYFRLVLIVFAVNALIDLHETTRLAMKVFSFRHRGLDERERVARDRAFRVSYRILAVVSLFALIGLMAASRHVDDTVLGAVGVGFFALILCLPVAVHAWTEPDSPLAERGGVSVWVGADVVTRAAVIVFLALVQVSFAVWLGLILLPGLVRGVVRFLVDEDQREDSLTPA